MTGYQPVQSQGNAEPTRGKGGALALAIVASVLPLIAAMILSAGFVVVGTATAGMVSALVRDYDDSYGWYADCSEYDDEYSDEYCFDGDDGYSDDGDEGYGDEYGDQAENSADRGGVVVSPASSAVSTGVTTETSYDEFRAMRDVGGMIVLVGSLFYLVAVIGRYVVGGLLLSRVFRRLGVEGWPAWVPVYNNWRMLELGGQPGWLALLVFIPGANIVSAVFLYISAHAIGKRFGRGGGWVALYIFLPLVWMALIGYSATDPVRPVWGAQPGPGGMPSGGWGAPSVGWGGGPVGGAPTAGWGGAPAAGWPAPSAPAAGWPAPHAQAPGAPTPVAGLNTPGAPSSELAAPAANRAATPTDDTAAPAGSATSD